MSTDSKTDTLPGRLMVISPHLDDGVFSCGELMASARGAMVVTIFSGVPPASQVLTEWDAACGFMNAQQAIAARREEDRHALEILHAEPLWLDFCDSQYGMTPTDAAIATAISNMLKQHCPDSVMIPAGLFHSDHELTHRAALQAWPNEADQNWFLYEDALYRRINGLLQQRLASLMNAGICATPAAFNTVTGVERKRLAARSYVSQLRALNMDGRPGIHDLDAPDRYWQLTRIPVNR
jgi:LmbE family N-acetylglucosaminyl deacetylase